MHSSHGAYAPVPIASSPGLISPFPGVGRRPFLQQNPSYASSSGSSNGNSVNGSSVPPQRRFIPASRPRCVLNRLSPRYPRSSILAPDPASWGSAITHAEPDDALHDPAKRPQWTQYLHNPRAPKRRVPRPHVPLLGYPLTQHFMNPKTVSLLHLNASGQVPNMGNWGLIDWDTPKDAHQIYSYHDPTQVLQLVFSDEFETDGRTFYPGDDPYWPWTYIIGKLEIRNGYDPAAIRTIGGAMEINLTKVLDPSMNHNLSYMGGMISTWNKASQLFLIFRSSIDGRLKFCFTGGLIVTNVMMPGITNIFGLWPAVWTCDVGKPLLNSRALLNAYRGNLGRAGYGASLDGMWPYSYDSCDVGTTPNQTLNGGPPAALHSGDNNGKTTDSPVATCMGESHPGPIHESDGSYVGRSAPEIDIFEAQIGGPDDAHVGQVSQSAQWAPFGAGYKWHNTTDNMVVVDWTLSHQNTYSGGIINNRPPSSRPPYITWISDKQSQLDADGGGVGADEDSGIAARPITQEPLYILANLGISTGFGFVDFEHITFPSTMRLDYVRVYQHPDKINIGCDPPERPTSYSRFLPLQIHRGVYEPLLTTWEDDYHQTVPKNKLIDQC
ncbi:beta-glucan synthesis-associated protein [Mycena olivaceomarginata]|nr:beta-glucan synthesis-associated protein [Mycena olivaceomarginata]